jgi:hypothetical protein
MRANTPEGKQTFQFHSSSRVGTVPALFFAFKKLQDMQDEKTIFPAYPAGAADLCISCNSSVILSIKYFLQL